VLTLSSKPTPGVIIEIWKTDDKGEQHPISTVSSLAHCVGCWVVCCMFENSTDAAPIPGPVPSPSTCYLSYHVPLLSFFSSFSLQQNNGRAWPLQIPHRHGSRLHRGCLLAFSFATPHLVTISMECANTSR